MRPNEDTRERFLTAIAAQIDRDGVVEAHLFQPLRQGEYESGVAVVAVEEHSRLAQATDTAGDPSMQDPQADGGTETYDDERRLAVYTAKYRLTIKGSERGKWEFEVHAEADAPLGAVDQVVRGVQRRSGDAEEAERLTGDEFRALLPPPSSAAHEPAQGQGS